MKAKVTVIIEVGDEKQYFSEKNDNASYRDVVDLINNASVRAEEVYFTKYIDEVNSETEYIEEVCEMCGKATKLKSDNLCQECWDSLP